MIALLHREWLLVLRRWHELLQTIMFVMLLSVIFTLAVGTDVTLLPKIAPGVVWVTVLLSLLLSSDSIFKPDYQDGSLTQLCLSRHHLLAVVMAKCIVYWVVRILPIVMALTILGLWYELPVSITLEMLMTLIIASPSLLLLAILGAALTLSVRRSSLLVVLMMLPFYIPTLVFAVAAINAKAEGFSNTGQLAMLGAILVVTMTWVPFAIVAVVRAALRH